MKATNTISKRLPRSVWSAIGAVFVTKLYFLSRFIRDWFHSATNRRDNVKIVTTLLTTVFSIFFAGSSISAPAEPWAPSGMGVGASSALMKVLKSPQAEMLSGVNECTLHADGEKCGLGVYTIFVQTRDAASMVSNVEALDTIYMFPDQSHVPQEPNWFMQVLELDKTNKELRLLRYKLVEGLWYDLIPHNPADIPDIDLQQAYRLVREQVEQDPWFSGDARTLARISIYDALSSSGSEWQVAFYIRYEGDADGICREWDYHVDGNYVSYGGPHHCFFQWDE